MQETQEKQVRSLGQEDPLEEEIAIHYSILAWKILLTEEPGSLQSSPRGRKELTWLSNWAHTHTDCAICPNSESKWVSGPACAPGPPDSIGCLHAGSLQRNRPLPWGPSLGLGQRQQQRQARESERKSLSFYWRVIALQCCGGLCRISVQISHNYIYVSPPSWASLPKEESSKCFPF